MKRESGKEYEAKSKEHIKKTDQADDSLAVQPQQSPALALFAENDSATSPASKIDLAPQGESVCQKKHNELEQLKQIHENTRTQKKHTMGANKKIQRERCGFSHDLLHPIPSQKRTALRQ